MSTGVTGEGASLNGPEQQQRVRWSWRRKVLLGFLVLVLVIAALCGYVALSIVGDLRAARATLAGDASNLTEDDLEATVGHLQNVSDVLDGPAGGALRFVPVISQNINALESVVNTSIPALEDARALSAEITSLEDAGLIEEGKIQVNRLARLEEPLERQATSLGALRDSLETHMNGWLLPPMWKTLETLSTKTTDLQRSALRAQAGVEVTSAMLNDPEGRTFLVLLLNNAELRGAGGILSGVGTLTIEDGEIELGDFKYYSELADLAGKQKKVEAPDDLVRRFGRYWADTTLWVNTSASPDVPEVAVTAGKLYQRTTGIETDGALIIDPRGLAALVPEVETVQVPGTDIELEQDELAEFMYSDSYRVFDEASRARREASLSLGPRILDLFFEQSLRRPGLARLESASLGQHLRVVSFDAQEQSILASLGVSGELTSEASDTSFFTVQNLGADKLDHWMRREIEHGCRLSEVGSAQCQTRITLRNKTPEGLPLYVTQDKKSYGLYEGYLETYIPEGASVTSYTVDGEEPEPQYFTEIEDRRQSLGAYFKTPRGKSTQVEVNYDLAYPEDEYTLEVLPQPLTNDAKVRVVLVAPAGWTIKSPDGETSTPLEYKGTLDRTLRFEATEKSRPGITGIWDRIVNFWNEPVF